MELRTTLRTICAALLIPAVILQIPAIRAFAKESGYPLVYDVAGQEDPVMVLTEPDSHYTVLSGDSLWKIAGKLWGDGSGYVKLIALNREILPNPDFIYEGMVLNTARESYIVRTQKRYGGVQMGEYSMDMPYGWTVGTSGYGDAFANFVLSGEENKSVACLIQDKRQETVNTLKDWEKCAQNITAYARAHYGEQVSNLTFEHYLMENQGDGNGKLYLYSYAWHITMTQPEFEGLELTVNVCVGLKMTEHLQAEFVGYQLSDAPSDLTDCVRYVAASFEEHYDAGSKGGFTVNDSNMCISPDTPWALDGIYNSFAFVEEYFQSFLDAFYEKYTGGESGEGKSYKGKLGVS